MESWLKKLESYYTAHNNSFKDQKEIEMVKHFSNAKWDLHVQTSFPGNNVV